MATVWRVLVAWIATLAALLVIGPGTALADGAPEWMGCVGEECATTMPPGAPTAESIRRLDITPDGRHAIAIATFWDLTSAVVVFARDEEGALTFSRCLSPERRAPCETAPVRSTVAGLRDLAIAPDGSAVYTAAQRVVGHYSLSPDGQLSYVDCLGTGDDRCRQPRADDPLFPGHLRISPDGRDLYTTVGDGVLQLRRGAGGLLSVGHCAGLEEGCTFTPQVLDIPFPYSVSALEEPTAFVVSPDGESVYVASGRDHEYEPGAISHLRRRPDGSLAYAGCIGADAYGCAALPVGVTATNGVNALAVSADSEHVYATAEHGERSGVPGADAVTRFSVADDGSLRFEDCVGAGPNRCRELPANVYALRYARSVAVTPDGGSVYAAGVGDGTIAHLGDDLEFASCVTGRPGTLTCRRADLGLVGDPTITVSPDGENLYVPGGHLNVLALRDAPPAPGGAAAVFGPPTVDADADSAWVWTNVEGDGRDITGVVEYGTTAAYGRSQPLVASSSPSVTSVDAPLNRLAPATTYHYRLVIEKDGVRASTPDATFTTSPGGAAAPQAETLRAHGGTPTAVRLHGAVNPGGLDTTYRFEWGPTDAYGSSTPAGALERDRADHDVGAVVTGLTPGTTYHYRVVATNASGTTFGQDRTLAGWATEPPPAGPFVATAPATGVTATTARAAASLNPYGVPATVRFEYADGSLVNYDTVPLRTPARAVPAGFADVPLTETLTGLKPSTTYEVRLVSESAAGIVRGNARRFNTPAAPTVTPAPTSTPTPPSQPAPALVGSTPQAEPARPVRNLSITPRALRKRVTIRYRSPVARTVELRITRRGRIVGSLRHHDRVGVNRIRWRGRLDGRRLPRGAYRLTVVAPGVAGPSVGFRVARSAK